MEQHDLNGIGAGMLHDLTDVEVLANRSAVSKEDLVFFETTRVDVKDLTRLLIFSGSADKYLMMEGYKPEVVALFHRLRDSAVIGDVDLGLVVSLLRAESI